MDARSEVLMRQAELFGGKILLAGLPADELLGQLPDACGWSWQWQEYRQLESRYPGHCHFGIHPQDGDFAGAVVFLPKARELADYLLSVLAAHLPGKPLWLVGEKRGGIESAGRKLAGYGKAWKLDSARHCQLWQAEIPAGVCSLPQQPIQQASTFAVGELTIYSLPGVFSHGRLDKGSQLLLEHLDDLPVGDVLDFGCGAGVLGATLARRYPDSRLHLLDVDAFALASSALTLDENELHGEIIAASGIEDAPTGLAAIVSNPPFHQGVHTSYEASEQLLRQAAAHLRPGGELRIVANSFLRYPPLIEQHLGPCEVLAERDGFRIYRARKA